MSLYDRNTQDAGRAELRQAKRAPGFARRHGAAVAAGIIVCIVVVVGLLFLIHSGSDQPVRRVQEFTMVRIQPPPPPPPPQPLPQPKMIEQPKITQPEIKQETPQPQPKEAPPKPVQAPPTGPLGLDTKATGPSDAFNLAGNPGGNGLLGGGGGGSRWGWYAGMVQTDIENALRNDKKTRDAVMRVEVRIWCDAGGRIERVKLAASTGDRAVDAAIEKDLPGLKLSEAPPKDMPMPIVTRFTGRRPS